MALECCKQGHPGVITPIRAILNNTMVMCSESADRPESMEFGYLPYTVAKDDKRC